MFARYEQEDNKDKAFFFYNQFDSVTNSIAYAIRIITEVSGNTHAVYGWDESEPKYLDNHNIN